MPGVLLKGSCHCGVVRFTVESSTNVPFALCYCSICRKTSGTGGATNLGGYSKSLNILQGKEHISVYNAVLDRDTEKERRANSERNFCSKCGTHLWLYDSTWPELIHPLAQVIDEPELPVPDSRVCIMVESKPKYVALPEGKKEVYDQYPELSLEDWHKKHGVYAE
ncbi:Mss4-like protein [Flagelloscypha sp. PMI_526]|nr:Mss4-like protein [Flagelloscypha sp. PMI_526]